MASVKVLYIKNKNITSCWKSNSICDLWICDMDLVKKCSQRDQLQMFFQSNLFQRCAPQSRFCSLPVYSVDRRNLRCRKVICVLLSGMYQIQEPKKYFENVKGMIISRRCIVTVSCSTVPTCGDEPVHYCSSPLKCVRLLHAYDSTVPNPTEEQCYQQTEPQAQDWSHFFFAMQNKSLEQTDYINGWKQDER